MISIWELVDGDALNPGTITNRRAMAAGKEGAINKRSPALRTKSGTSRLHHHHVES